MTISINKPTVGGSENTWGTTINTALDDVVDVLNGDTASTPDLTEGSWKVGGTAVTADAAEINKLDGFTGDAADLNYAQALRATGVTATEFNKLDGFTGDAGDLNYAKDLRATGVTTTELSYTDGVTSNIQTQLNAKAPTASPTFTGTANIPTVNATTVDLGNWTISQSGSSLKFFYNGTARFALSSSGALTVENNVTAYGSA